MTISSWQVARRDEAPKRSSRPMTRLKLASRGSNPQHHRDTKRIAMSDDGVGHLVVLQLEVSSQCLGQPMNVYGLDRVGPGLQLLPYIPSLFLGRITVLLTTTCPMSASSTPVDWPSSRP